MFFDLIRVIASSVGIDCEESIYKKRKGALIVDLLARCIKEADRHTCLILMKAIREIINESSDIRKWINNNLERIELAGLNDVDALSLYVELDSSDGPPYFYSLYKDKLKKLVRKSDVQTISEIYNFLWGFIRHEKNTSNIAKLLAKEKKVHYLKKIQEDALLGIENILAMNCKNVVQKKNKNNRRSFVIAIGFIPGHVEATHLNYIYNLAVSMKRAVKNSDLYLVITGEPLIDSVYTGEIYDDEIVSKFEGFWESVNGGKGFSYIKKRSDANDFCKWIDRISPDLFFSLGGVFKTEICSRLAHQSYDLPVIFVPASNSNKITFPVDGALVTNEEMYNDYSIKVGENSCFLLRPINKSILNQDPFLDIVIRANVDEFIAAVVLNSNRIAQWFESLDSKKLEQFTNFFDRHKRFKLLLIGESDCGRICAVDENIKKLVDEGRIIILGKVKQLRGLYGDIDLVLSLPGVAGGGGAIKTALSDNLMCICWNKSDACLHVHEDFQYSDVNGLLANLECAIIDPFYKKNNLTMNLGLQNKIEDDKNFDVWRSAINSWSAK